LHQQEVEWSKEVVMVVVMTGLTVRLVDVGDAWRALLLGAPPILL
jgi:hypothetical protein